MKSFSKNSQITIFTLTYSAMLVRRSALEVWSLSKTQIESDLNFSSTLLGVYDTAYLLSYALGEYVNGYLCDKIGETLIVSIGLSTAGLGLISMAALGVYDVGNVYLFCLLWVAQGYSHSAVLPGGVSLMSQYFSAETRGKTMGLWSTGASAGNIFGILIYTLLLNGLSFNWKEIILACAIVILAIALVFKTIIHSPSESELLLNKSPISFWEVWKIEGVAEYTITYSCCKFMNYTWIMWLPYYLYTVVGLDQWDIGILTLMYEVGAVIGAFGGGWISDKIHSRCRTVKFMLASAVPFVITLWYMEDGMEGLIGFCTFGLGLSVAGVCYLINSCVSADLAVGGHQIATISGIMDGTGSLVAGVGVFFVGYLQIYTWALVFGIVVVMNCIAVAMLQLIQYKKKKEIC